MNMLDPKRMTEKQRHIVAARLRAWARKIDSQGLTYNQSRAWMAMNYAALADLYQHSDAFYRDVGDTSEGNVRSVTYASTPVRWSSPSALCLEAKSH